MLTYKSAICFCLSFFLSVTLIGAAVLFLYFYLVAENHNYYSMKTFLFDAKGFILFSFWFGFASGFFPLFALVFFFFSKSSSVFVGNIINTYIYVFCSIIFLFFFGNSFDITDFMITLLGWASVLIADFIARLLCGFTPSQK